MIYEPAEDSYLLEKEVKKYVQRKSFLDMGSGSGIQSKSAKQGGASSILAVDSNPESVKLLKKKKIPSKVSDLFSNIHETFDIIAFNPPYLPHDDQEDKESQSITTGGKKGDELILRFLKQVSKHLNKKGSILLVVSSLTPKKSILELLKKLNMKHTVVAEKRLFFEKLQVWKITPP